MATILISGMNGAFLVTQGFEGAAFVAAPTPTAAGGKSKQSQKIVRRKSSAVWSVVKGYLEMKQKT